MGVIQPAIWLFLFGELFHKVIDIPGFGYQGSYLAYLIPGIVAMNAMSGTCGQACRRSRKSTAAPSTASSSPRRAAWRS